MGGALGLSAASGPTCTIAPAMLTFSPSPDALGEQPPTRAISRARSPGPSRARPRARLGPGPEWARHRPRARTAPRENRGRGVRLMHAEGRAAEGEDHRPRAVHPRAIIGASPAGRARGDGCSLLVELAAPTGPRRPRALTETPPVVSGCSRKAAGGRTEALRSPTPSSPREVAAPVRRRPTHLCYARAPARGRSAPAVDRGQAMPLCMATAAAPSARVAARALGQPRVPIRAAPCPVACTAPAPLARGD
jgi:hypothetical protein